MFTYSETTLVAEDREEKISCSLGFNKTFNIVSLGPSLAIQATLSIIQYILIYRSSGKHATAASWAAATQCMLGCDICHCHMQLDVH